MKRLLLILVTMGLSACSSGGGDGPSISGKIVLNGVPLAGVVVTVSGAMTASAATDSGGYYTVHGVKNGGYSVNPALAGYRFTPAARPTVMSGSNLAGYDFVATAAPPVTAVLLPRTGQVATYQPGDDGSLQKGAAWPSPRFADSNNGAVTDRLTGLIWLKDAACIGRKNWNDALAAANGLASGICGLSDDSKAGDWRLPNVTELNSLVNLGRWNPSVGPMQTADTAAPLPFNGVANYSYWSSTTSAALATQAWTIHFLFGLVNPPFKKIPFLVWPVRDAATAGTISLPRTGQRFSYAAGDDGYHQKGALWPTPRFTDNGNGAFTDNLTKLVWLKDANCTDEAGGQKRIQPATPTVSATFSVLRYGQALTWVGALHTGICGLSDGSSSGDWRLPNRLEIQSLIDYSQGNPALPFDHLFLSVQAQGIWTATAFTTSSNDSPWFIYPESGVINASTYGSYYLWAVRDGAP